jgi:hypothetical protein
MEKENDQVRSVVVCWFLLMPRWHTGFPSGLRERPAGEYHKDHPDRIIKRAILGMLPKNKLFPTREKRLKVIFRLRCGIALFIYSFYYCCRCEWSDLTPRFLPIRITRIMHNSQCLMHCTARDQRTCTHLGDSYDVCLLSE